MTLKITDNQYGPIS